MYRLLKKMLITVVFVVSLVSCVTFGILGSALFQEGNPIPLLVSIVKLKLTDTDYVQFLNTEKQSRYLSSDTSHPPYKQVKEFMKSNGWDFEEQMGSGLIFLKDEKEALVMTRQYSKYFVIWDVSKSVIR